MSGKNPNRHDIDRQVRRNRAIDCELRGAFGASRSRAGSFIRCGCSTSAGRSRLRGKSAARLFGLRDCSVMFALIVCGISFGGAPMLAQEAGGPNINNLQLIPSSSSVDLSIPHWQDGCETRCCASNLFYHLCVIPRGLEPAVQHDILEVEEKG